MTYFDKKLLKTALVRSLIGKFGRIMAQKGNQTMEFASIR